MLFSDILCRQNLLKLKIKWVQIILSTHYIPYSQIDYGNK